MKKILEHQTELTLLQENVWESKFPEFSIQYNGDSRRTWVVTRSVKNDKLDSYIENVIKEAKRNYKDIVFYKYKKWDTIIVYPDFIPTEVTMIRYCHIEREI